VPSVYAGTVVHTSLLVGIARPTQDVKLSHFVSLDSQNQRIRSSQSEIRYSLRVRERTVLKYIRQKLFYMSYFVVFFSFNCFCFSCHNLLFSTHFCHHSIGIIAFNKTAKFSEILQIAPRNLATFDAKKRGPCSSSSSLLLLVLLILQYLSCIYMFVRCRTRKRETLS